MKNELTQKPNSKPLFPLGKIVATPGASAALIEYSIAPTTLLLRHVSGDWGQLSDHDREQNRFALRAGLRIFSSYSISLITTIWIITEADRTSTTILLPDEY